MVWVMSFLKYCLLYLVIVFKYKKIENYKIVIVVKIGIENMFNVIGIIVRVNDNFRGIGFIFSGIGGFVSVWIICINFFFIK